MTKRTYGAVVMVTNQLIVQRHDVIIEPASTPLTVAITTIDLKAPAGFEGEFYQDILKSDPKELNLIVGETHTQKIKTHLRKQL